MTQETAIVTGASSGIGLYTALALARLGMAVVMVGRHAGRTARACRFIVEETKNENVSTALADFSELSAVRRLAEELLSTHPRIDLLINNAGMMSERFRLSEEGHELTFAVNHLAPFLLTHLLLERVRASAPARIITVASEAHRGARLDLSAINNPAGYTMLRAYGRSKLCNILFNRELALRLEGSGVIAVSLHPGVVATGIAKHGGLVELGWRLARPFLLTPEKGAATTLFLATTPEPEPFHGTYVVGQRAREPDDAARDPELARELWSLSARLAGIEESSDQ